MFTPHYTVCTHFRKVGRAAHDLFYVIELSGGKAQLLSGGGIHRDIFTMGARPIAALNSLRFGNLNEAKTQYLVAGVVHGIGHYGNCFGVPTVGGRGLF